MSSANVPNRTIGLFGATGVGVGAIVGGGILALAGAAFAATGPSALIAFALNGVIALLTALSFAEVASKFPQSGGTYNFAKKVLSVEAAFTVGWVVWFASIVAGALYALGFGYFAVLIIEQIWIGLGGDPPVWLTQRPMICGLAATATIIYTVSLLRKKAGGGNWINISKLIVFTILIVCGFWALRGRTVADLGESLQPFFAEGATGLFQAMGFTFIALQGFDLIAAIAGEIRNPERNIPRAMFGSLGISLAIYLPLLFVISTVGMPVGQSVTAASRENAESIIAIAAQNYLGTFGFWLVMVAAVLSMLSALQANLFAASRVAWSMAHDRTLPRSLTGISSRGTPRSAILVTALIIIAVLITVPNVAAAGAAASLIFLITFALAHWIAILVRQRSLDRPPPFRAPWFPIVPVLGGLACVGLAIYQGIAVPSAGLIAAAWLTLGGLLFLGLFAQKARVADASTAAFNPEVVTMRGRNPLVLVPIARPDSAGGLVAVAQALAPHGVGRVLLLTVVVAPRNWRPDEDDTPLLNAQSVLSEAIRASAVSGVFPEALSTVAKEPWQEIYRVAKVRQCETLLLGMSRIADTVSSQSERLFNQVECDVVVLRAEKGWQLSDAHRILVPTAGRGGHDVLLARLLGSFSRSVQRDVTFLRVLPETADSKEQRQAKRELSQMAANLGCAAGKVEVVCDKDVLPVTVEFSKQSDLIILGVQRKGRRQKVFGSFATDLAKATDCPLLLISYRR